jgi:hypothetical protein
MYKQSMSQTLHTHYTYMLSTARAGDSGVMRSVSVKIPKTNSSSSAAAAAGTAGAAAARVRSEDTLVLALRTLGSFRMDAFCLLPFVRDHVVTYLSDVSAHVRKEAALTCCQLVAAPPQQSPAAPVAASSSAGRATSTAGECTGSFSNIALLYTLTIMLLLSITLLYYYYC